MNSAFVFIENKLIGELKHQEGKIKLTYHNKTSVF